MQEMKLQDLKTKSPTELLSFAEEVAVENASAMRKQELMFAILKQLAARDVDITGTGVVDGRVLVTLDEDWNPAPDLRFTSDSIVSYDLEEWKRDPMTAAAFSVRLA